VLQSVSPDQVLRISGVGDQYRRTTGPVIHGQSEETKLLVRPATESAPCVNVVSILFTKHRVESGLGCARKLIVEELPHSLKLFKAMLGIAGSSCQKSMDCTTPRVVKVVVRHQPASSTL
jgi:hypothetical protein